MLEGGREGRVGVWVWLRQLIQAHWDMGSDLRAYRSGWNGYGKAEE